MTNHNQTLGEQIEELVREHISDSCRTAEAALQRAFGSAMATPVRAARSAGPRKSGKRRTPADIAALAERVYEVVCAKPGETMVVLAAEFEASASELHRPMANLKRAGRVRCVGQRHLMRYFPTAAGSERSA